MSLVGLALLGVVLSAGAGALGAATAGPRGRAVVAGVSTGVVGAFGVLAGVSVLGGGETFSVTVPQLLPLSEAVLAVDALSGVFCLLVGGVAIVAGLYSIGYTGGDHASDSGAGSRTAASRARPHPDIPYCHWRHTASLAHNT